MDEQRIQVWRFSILYLFPTIIFYFRTKKYFKSSDVLFVDFQNRLTDIWLTKGNPGALLPHMIIGDTGI